MYLQCAGELIVFFIFLFLRAGSKHSTNRWRRSVERDDVLSDSFVVSLGTKARESQCARADACAAFVANAASTIAANGVAHVSSRNPATASLASAVTTCVVATFAPTTTTTAATTT